MLDPAPGPATSASPPPLARNGLPLPERLVNVALLLAVGMLPLAPHQTHLAVPAATSVLILLYLASPSLWPCWVATFAASLTVRWTGHEAPWFDQTFVQQASLSALLSGHGIYSLDNLMQATWSVYLPMGDLMIALPVGFLGAHYLLFFQVLVPVLYSLPFLLAPGATTFRLFLALSLFFPLLDYTAKGGTLEIAAAASFAAVWLIANGRRPALAGGFAAYAGLLRQPLLLALPFSLLALWRERSRRGLQAFAAVLLFGGAVHVLRNPRGFLTATLTLWPDFADQWFNKLGNKGNYSLSSLLVYLGLPGAAARDRTWVYLSALALILAALAAFAWRARDTRAVLACGVLASLAAHLVSRGFVHFHYLVAALVPALALLPSSAPTEPQRRSWFSERVADLALFALAALVAAPLVAAGIGELRGAAPRGESIEVAAIEFTSITGAAGRLRNEPIAWAPKLDRRRPVVVELGRMARVVEVQMVGQILRPRVVDGVTMVTPGEEVVVGFLVAGRLEGSADGETWRELIRFRNLVQPSVYPARIRLAEPSPPIRWLRVSDGETWGGGDLWRLSGVRVFGQPAEAGTPSAVAP